MGEDCRSQNAIIHCHPGQRSVHLNVEPFLFFYNLGSDFITQIKQDRCITVLVVFVIVCVCCVCPYANTEQRFVLLVSRIVFGLLVNYQAAPFDRPQMKSSLQQKRD